MNPALTDRVGQRNLARNGMWMEIIEYRSARDVDAQFDDGVVVEHITYSQFKAGEVGNPNIKCYKKPEVGRVGETGYSKDNVLLTIVHYESAANIDVMAETGRLIKHRTYKDFRDRRIVAIPYENKRIGETSKSNNGQMMTIVAYRGISDIDVQFEDGTIVLHKTYKNFKKGKIANPNYNEAKNKYLGMTAIMNNGMEATITEFISTRDISVTFVDGTVVEHVTVVNFLKGRVSNPNCIKAVTRLGETNKATNGQMMTIVGYNSCIDMTVKFEDGTVVEHIRYTNFLEGTVSNPNYTYLEALADQKVNKTVTTTIGLLATLVEIRSNSDGLIQYETGYSMPLKNYSNFERGRISHPFPYQIGDVTMEKPAYVYGTTGNFYCKCNKCNQKNIWTVQEVREHICRKL